MAKEDPSVFFDPVAPLVYNLLVQTSLDDHLFKFEHTKLMELYMKEKTDRGCTGVFPATIDPKEVGLPGVQEFSKKK